jgi:hypothetical protein
LFEERGVIFEEVIDRISMVLLDFNYEWKTLTEKGRGFDEELFKNKWIKYLEKEEERLQQEDPEFLYAYNWTIS